MRDWKRWLLASVICWGLPSAVNAEPHAKDMAGIQAAVRDTLKDPVSAKFKRDAIQPADLAGDGLYYGCVNAKNSYGGYVGFRPFLAFVAKDKTWQAVVAQDDTMSAVFHKSGVEKGYDLDC
mgnify:CR=1 FL=1